MTAPQSGTDVAGAVPTRRIHARGTALSWIPVEAIRGITRVPFDRDIGHYDPPPPDRIEGTEQLLRLRQECRFRFANHLEAWIDVAGGRIVGHGQSGEAFVSSTRMDVGRVAVAALPVVFPELRGEPDVRPDAVRFSQTGGGRAGVPFPRIAGGRLRVDAPLAWSSLAVTVHVDGRVEVELTGASAFPRHWVYGSDGRLVAKSGLIDYREWWRTSSLAASPWGGRDRQPLVAAAESDAERQLSVAIIDGERQWRRLAAGDLLCREGEPAKEVFLLFDGVVEVSRGGELVAELGPGVIVGEMGVLGPPGERRRGATVRALTPCRVAAVAPDRLDRGLLERVARSRADAS